MMIPLCFDRPSREADSTEKVPEGRALGKREAIAGRDEDGL
jgi:hypothetical protein